jgi:hypothetical protein
MAQIDNTNFLTSIGFNVIIEKIPTVTFFAKSVSLPGITVNNPKIPTPFIPFPVAADTSYHGTFSMVFNIDEDLTNWMELYSWLVGMTFPESHEQWKTFIGTTTGTFAPGNQNNVYSDITVQTLTSAKNVNKQITYHNCILKTVSGFDLTNAGTDPAVVTSTAEFDFSHFSIK